MEYLISLFNSEAASRVPLIIFIALMVTMCGNVSRGHVTQSCLYFQKRHLKEFSTLGGQTPPCPLAPEGLVLGLIIRTGKLH